MRSPRPVPALLAAAGLALSLGAAPAAAAKLPNLAITKISNPKASAHPGDQLKVTDTVTNSGAKAAKPSKARFYLSADRKRGAGDTRLAGTEQIGKLQPGVKANASGSFGIPNATAGGKYFLIGCADDTRAVKESSEKDNCLASAKKVKIALKPPKVTTPYEINNGTIPIGTRVSVSGLEVTAVGSGGLFWVEVPSANGNYTGPENSGLEASIQFSPPPTLTVGDRVQLIGTTRARSFEGPTLEVSAVSTSGSGPVNAPVLLADQDFASPPAGLNGVLVETDNAKKTAESPGHDQWVMLHSTHGFGITDLIIGTLPAVADNTTFSSIVGIADTTTSQVVLFPRSNGDIQN